MRHLKHTLRNVVPGFLAFFCFALTGCDKPGSAHDGKRGGVSPAPPFTETRFDGIEIKEMAAAKINGKTAKKALVGSLYAIDFIEALAMRYKGERSEDAGRFFFHDLDLLPYLFRPDTLVAEPCRSGSAEIYESGRVSQASRHRDDAIVVVFNNCDAGGRTFSGVIRAKDILSDNSLIAYEAIFERLIFSSPSEGVEVELNGGLRIEHLDSAEPAADRPVWAANLTVRDLSTNITTAMHNLTRLGVGERDYSVNGSVSRSGFGSLQLQFDSSTMSVQLTGQQSSLSYKSYFLPDGTETPHLIGLDSDGDGTNDQTVEQSLDDLLSVQHNESFVPQLTIIAPPLVETGQTIPIETSIFANDEQFYHWEWDVRADVQDCPLMFSGSATGKASFSSSCHGAFTVVGVMDNGFRRSTAEFDIFVHRPEPSIGFQGVPQSIRESDTLNIALAPHNPQDGPFDYSMVFGLPGTQLDEGKILTWSAISPIYSLQPTISANFGFTATNDLSTVARFDVALELESFAEPTFIPLTEGQERVYSRLVTDLEPANHQGDIAFVREDRVFKYNKRTGLVRVLDVVLPNGGVDGDRYSDIPARVTLSDINDDGVKDLAYISITKKVLEGSLEEVSEKRLYAFDMLNESVLSGSLMVTTRFKDSVEESRGVGLQRVHLPGDLSESYIFLLEHDWGMPAPRGGVVDYPAGVYRFDAVSNKLTRLYTTSSQFHSLLVRDTNADGRLEFYLVASTYRFQVIKLRYESGQMVVEGEYQSSGDETGRLYISAFRDIDGDGVEELTIADEGNCHLYERGATSVVLSSDLEQLRFLQMNIELITGAAPQSSYSGANVHALIRSCASGTVQFANVNLDVGQVIWTAAVESVDAHQILAAPDAAVSFVDGAGASRLFFAGLLGIHILH